MNWLNVEMLVVCVLNEVATTIVLVSGCHGANGETRCVSGPDTLNVEDASWKIERNTGGVKGTRSIGCMNAKTSTRIELTLNARRTVVLRVLPFPTFYSFTAFFMTEGACIAVANQQRAT